MTTAIVTTNRTECTITVIGARAECVNEDTHDLCIVIAKKDRFSTSFDFWPVATETYVLHATYSYITQSVMK